MTTDKPSHLVPRLRFPEFCGSGEWETRKWGNIVQRGKETFDPQTCHDTPFLIELENIESRTGRILGVSELEKQNSLKSKFQAGDVLFGKLRPYLQKYARPEFHGVCTSEIWVLRSLEASSAFLFYLIQSERFTQLANISSGSRMPRADWNFIASEDFEIPHSDEQQKIADCLGSLDDLIAAEGRKLEALRQHKKGLMQQLFPQPGETVPRLRFKDDQGEDYPDWNTKFLGDLYDITSSKRVFQSEWKGSGIPFYRAREIIELSKYGTVNNDLFISPEMYEKYSRKYGAPQENDLLVTGVGTIGKLYVVPMNRKIYFKDGNIVWFKNLNRVSSIFVKYLFGTRYVEKQLVDNASITTVATYTIEAAKKTRVLIPVVKKQQKIADCLGSLDDLIAAEGRKIEALRQHKKGLMQQLFPSPD